jgi:hypothetical protein
MNMKRNIMFKKSKSATPVTTNTEQAGKNLKREQIAEAEAELRYDSDDDDQAVEGSAEETARYIADMVGALAAMSGDARLDLLTYLLNMARVEAEMQARRSESLDD